MTGDITVDSFAGRAVPQWIVSEAGARSGTPLPNSGAARRRTDSFHASFRTVSAKKRSPVSTITSTNRSGTPRTLFTDRRALNSARSSTRHHIFFPECGSIRPISPDLAESMFCLSISSTAAVLVVKQVVVRPFNDIMPRSLKYDACGQVSAGIRRSGQLKQFSILSAALDDGAPA